MSLNSFIVLAIFRILFAVLFISNRSVYCNKKIRQVFSESLALADYMGSYSLRYQIIKRHMQISHTIRNRFKKKKIFLRDVCHQQNGQNLLNIFFDC